MQPLANALLITLEIHTLSANQNVWSTQNAPETRLVSIRSAETPVLGFVVPMHIAQQQTTMQCASVSLATLAMLLLPVRGSLHVSYICLINTQMLNFFFRTTQSVNTKTRSLQSFSLWVKCTLY